MNNLKWLNRLFAVRQMKKQDKEKRKEEKWIAKVNKRHQVIISNRDYHFMREQEGSALNFN